MLPGPRISTFPAILLAFLPAGPLAAQGGAVHVHDNPGWFVYSGEHPFARGWTLNPEVQARRADVLATWQELQLRQGVGYALSSAVNLAAAYTYARSYSYGPGAEPFPYPEHRIHEQVTVSHRAGKWKLGHRFRVDHRFLGELPDPPRPRVARWEYETRLRYRLQPRREFRDWHLRIAAESLIRIGKGRAWDQQRTYAGIGRKLWKHLTVEAGYMHRLNVPGDGPFFEHDHIFHLIVSSDAPLRRGIQ